MIRAVRWLLCLSAFLKAGMALACEPATMAAVQASAAQSPAQHPSLHIIYDPGGRDGGGGPGVLLQAVMQRVFSNCDDAEPAADHKPQRRFPMGDTIFMRYPDLFPAMDDAARRRFVAAEIARSPDVAISLLHPLTTEDQPRLVRYRAILEILLRQLRSGRHVATDHLTLLQRARGLVPEDLTPDPSADLDFVEGVFCLREGGEPETCIDHLDRALSGDPAFLAARQIRIRIADVLLRRLSSFGRQAACERLLARLFLDLDLIVRGVPSGSARVAIGNNLDAAARSGNVALYFGAAIAFSEAGAHGKARLALADAAIGIGDARGCAGTLKPYLERLAVHVEQE